jgi:hypothetical protein
LTGSVTRVGSLVVSAGSLVLPFLLVSVAGSEGGSGTVARLGLAFPIALVEFQRVGSHSRKSLGSTYELESIFQSVRKSAVELPGEGNIVPPGIRGMGVKGDQVLGDPGILLHLQIQQRHLRRRLEMLVAKHLK